MLNGHLYVGSSPYSGSTGAVSRYNLTTGSLSVNTQDFAGRSVAALAVHQGVLWGGTAGGPNGAELFRVDAATGRVVARYVPISGGKRIGALVSGPFNKLWGVVDGTLFVFDPATKTFTHLGGLPGSNGDASGAGIVWHPNGQIYAVSGGQLYQVDPATKAKTALRTSGVWRLALQGNDLYFKDGTSTPSGIRLWRYTP